MEGLGGAAQRRGPFRHLGWPFSAALSLSSHGALPSCCSLPSRSVHPRQPGAGSARAETRGVHALGADADRGGSWCGRARKLALGGATRRWSKRFAGVRRDLREATKTLPAPLPSPSLFPPPTPLLHSKTFSLLA